MRVVRQNLIWAFGYNALGVAAAALGLLRPVFAAAAMVLSSLFVVGNSLRLQRPASLSAGRSYRREAGRWPARGVPEESLPG